METFYYELVRRSIDSTRLLDNSFSCAPVVMIELWIWVLGIELDIFIIGVNPTRDSRKIQGEILEA
eukprot:COSAG01_NODE_13639_length_1554_cov_8.675601_3_plen_65_part_01